MKKGEIIRCEWCKVPCYALVVDVGLYDPIMTSQLKRLHEDLPALDDVGENELIPNCPDCGGKILFEMSDED